MPLKQLSKQEYEALYREALFILKKLCNDKFHPDHEDIAHQTLEFYFVMKRDYKDELSLEQAVSETLRSHPCKRNKKKIVQQDQEQSKDPLAQREAQRDLDKIYLCVQENLSLHEKYIFCMLLLDNPASAMMTHLKLTEVEFLEIKDSLIGKLHYAATSASLPQRQSADSDQCIGKLKRKNHRH